MRNTRLIVVLALAALLVPPAALFAQEAEEPSGREIVDRGTVGRLTGTLVADGDEWQLQVDDRLYDLHLGQFGHDGKTTTTLRAGDRATVKGFIYGAHVSPITVESGGKTLRFRDENGRPLWSGMRLGPNAQDRPPLNAPGAGAYGPGADGPRADGWGRNRTQG